MLFAAAIWRSGSAAWGCSSGQSGSDHKGGCVTLMGGFGLGKTVTRRDLGRRLRHEWRIYGLLPFVSGKESGERSRAD